MNNERPVNDADPIEALVRGHLDREEAKIDAQRLLTRVRSGTATQPVRVAIWKRTARWGAGAAAIAAAVFVVLWALPPSVASAETLLQEAQAVHAAPVDRLYQIETSFDSGWNKKFPIFGFQRQAKLWTRGDRYYFETSGDNHSWTWGKDDRGQLWIALNSRLGVIFSADESDDAAFLASDIYSMKLESLLGELPRSHALKREPIPGKPGFVRIEAQSKSGAAKLKQASLEIDEKTKIIHKLTLKRTLKNESQASVTYTLVDTATLPDIDYQLNGHLDADGKTLGPDRPAMRNTLWKRVLDKRGMLKE